MLKHWLALHFCLYSILHLQSTYTVFLHLSYFYLSVLWLSEVCASLERPVFLYDFWLKFTKHTNNLFMFMRSGDKGKEYRICYHILRAINYLKVFIVFCTCLYGDQRTTYWTQFSPSTLWVHRIKFRLSSLAISTLTHQAISN